jgi:2-keto-4-pentenoate hydratase/2-oxohepta-3-ene-1,7-dioic acid hydratase in catechol pathway
MQFVRFTTSGSPAWGIRRGEEIIPLAGLREDITYQQLTDSGFLRVVEDAADAMAAQAIPASEANLLAPVPRPGKIICVGLNYYDHAEEQDEDVPDQPLLFGKSGTAVTNPGDPIIHPEELDEVDFEVELGVVIGRTAKDVTTADARDYVAGYTAINDVSGRDAQFDDGQFFRGKSYDTFAPMGPTLVPDERLDPEGLDVICRVNGETMQSSNTEEFIFGVEEVVSYISGITTLRPGDVISTGTPGGVGIFRDPPELLEPGDSVDVEIEGIGTLTNPVIAERD